MLSKIKYWFLFLAKPIQKLMQKFGRTEPRMTYEMVTKLLPQIKPGTILLSYESQRFTSFFIKGYYKHAAIVTSRMTVVEAVGDNWHIIHGESVNLGGVREVNLIEWLLDKDNVAAIDLDPNVVKDAIQIMYCVSEFALTLLKPKRNYDYVFSHKNEDLYCTEIPYVCYKVFFADFLAEIPEDREILPQAYWDMAGHNIAPYLDRVFDTREMQVTGT